MIIFVHLPFLQDKKLYTIIPAIVLTTLIIRILVFAVTRIRE